MPIAIEKLGWMAGILDLKGRLQYKNNQKRNTQQVTLSVDTKDFNVLRRLTDLTGTKSELHVGKEMPSFMRRGCTEHCPEDHICVGGDVATRMPPIGRWTITGAGMVVVLHNLMPYLINDRGYTEAMELVKSTTVFTGQGSGMVRVSMKRLAEAGWSLPDEFLVKLFNFLEDEDADRTAIGTEPSSDPGPDGPGRSGLESDLEGSAPEIGSH